MSKDRDLGMDRKITRRDFVEGASVAIAGSMLPGEILAAAPGANASSILKNYMINLLAHFTQTNKSNISHFSLASLHNIGYYLRPFFI